MNALRLSLFNLKKNRKEAIAIAFLTMLTTLMLAVFAANLSKSSKAFDDSFASSGAYNRLVFIEKSKYRDIYRDILEDEYGITDIAECDMVGCSALDVQRNDEEKTSNNYWFLTEKSERKIEDFVKHDQLPDAQITELEHPIWLPVYFQIAQGYVPGDTFNVLYNGKTYPFTVAGFFEAGLFATSGYGYRCVISEEDYALFRVLFQSGYSMEYKALSFDADEDFKSYDFIRNCCEVSGENIKSTSGASSEKGEKETSLQFMDMFMYFLAFFSGVTLLAALLMIVQRISDDINDQMQQIGVLEALGYRSWEISLSYVYEYLICGGIGAALGAVGAVLVSPAMNLGIQGMIGRIVTVKTDVGKILLAALFVTLMVVVFALLKAAKIKKLPPVIAFRKGIQTHHFGRNLLPLEKTKGSINLALAMKSFLGDLKSSAGVALCIITSGVAILFCVTGAYDFRGGIDYLLSMCNYDITVEVTVNDGVDPYAVRDEIAEMPEVRKALVTYKQVWLPVKGSENEGSTSVFEDFADAENIRPARGRFPEHDNEIMITVGRSREEGIDIGDSIILEGNGMEQKYIITGVTSSLMNNGMGLYLTSEGYARTQINDRPNVVSVYLADGVTEEQFQEQLDAKFGRNQTPDPADTSLEARVRAAADEKMQELVAHYGVTNADYAVVVGDTVIKGNSRQFLIKDVLSLMGLAKESMSAVSNITRYGSTVLAAVLAAVVAVILGLIVSSSVKRQRKSLGILKGMGYSSKDLRRQVALKIMPVTIVSVIIASVLTGYVYSAFWMMAFSAVGTVTIPVIVIADVILVAFCYLVTYLCAGKIKAISVTELMTE